MLSRRNCGCLLGVIGICLLVSSTSFRGGIERCPDVVKRWRDLGRLVIYQSGAGRSLSAEWFDHQLDVDDPNSETAVRTTEFVLMKAFEAFGQEVIAVTGRIPLDVNPQCILGLYSAERFPGTRLGDWGTPVVPAMC